MPTDDYDHSKSYFIWGKSRVSARGMGFLVLCLSVPAVMLTSIYTDVDKDIVMILVGAYAAAVGSATTAYFQQDKK